MIKGLVLAGAVGAAALVVVAATGGVDDLRRQLPDIRKPFIEVNDALRGAQDRERQWDKVVKDANSICGRYPQGGFTLSLTLPANRRRYVRAISVELEREGSIQSGLAELLPPANYEGPYSLFLHNRRDALSALERLRRATGEKNRADYEDAARVFKQKKTFADHYAVTVGMSACVF